jgi:hypothetical protein
LVVVLFAAALAFGFFDTAQTGAENVNDGNGAIAGKS